MHGAVPVWMQRTSESWILLSQHSSGPRSGSAGDSHVSPPQTPHDSGQQTKQLSDWIPSTPLSHLRNSIVGGIRNQTIGGRNIAKRSLVTKVGRVMLYILYRRVDRELYFGFAGLPRQDDDTPRRSSSCEGNRCLDPTQKDSLKIYIYIDRRCTVLRDDITCLHNYSAETADPQTINEKIERL